MKRRCARWQRDAQDHESSWGSAEEASPHTLKTRTGTYTRPHIRGVFQWHAAECSAAHTSQCQQVLQLSAAVVRVANENTCVHRHGGHPSPHTHACRASKGWGCSPVLAALCDDDTQSKQHITHVSASTKWGSQKRAKPRGRPVGDTRAPAACVR